MTRNRVLIAGAFFVLALLVLLPLWQPREKAEIQETAPEVQALIPEVGRYELAPSTQNAVELPSEAASRDIVNTVTADPQKKAPRKPKPAEVEQEDPGYDSVDPGLVQPPPKLPPAEQLNNMQRRGIVAY